MSRPVGSKNKMTAALKLDLIQTLRKKGFDPAAELISCYVEAKKLYRKRVKTNNGFGAIGALQVAEKAAADMMPYVYHSLRAVEVSGKDGADFFESFTNMVRQITDKEDEKQEP